MEKTNDVLKFAKQGNPKAIEAIFSKQLKAKNIVVKAVVRDGCLQIMFESKQALSQVTMVNGVKKVLTGIKPENIQTVKVYSKKSGDDFPKWHEEFELAEKKKVDVSPNIDLIQLEVPKLLETTIPTSDSNESLSQAKNSAQLIDTNAKSHVNDLTNNLTSPNIADEDSSLMEKARWGYLDSISTLLNSAFNGQGVSASLNKPRVKLLEIVLKSNGIIDKQIAIEIICRILNKTKTRVFNEVSISVDTSESNFLSWNQNLIFKDNQFIADDDSSLMEKARLGYLDSISTLLNSAFTAFTGQGISASLNKPRANFLEIVLKSNGIIDKQVAIEIICRILNKTETRFFNAISVSVDTSESNFPSWKQNLIFKDNQFVVSSSDSDVFSHLAKFVIEAMDNIDTRINSKLNSLSNQYLDELSTQSTILTGFTQNTSLKQDSQLIENISNALKQYNKALSIVKAKVVDNICLDLEIESKEELNRVNFLFIAATIGKELNKLNEEPIELVYLILVELKEKNRVVVFTKEIYKISVTNQSIYSIQPNNLNQNSYKAKSNPWLFGVLILVIGCAIAFNNYQIYTDGKERSDRELKRFEKCMNEESNVKECQKFLNF